MLQVLCTLIRIFHLSILVIALDVLLVEEIFQCLIAIYCLFLFSDFTQLLHRDRFRIELAVSGRHGIQSGCLDRFPVTLLKLSENELLVLAHTLDVIRVVADTKRA